MAEIQWKSAQEIEEEKNQPKTPTSDERIKILEDALLNLILGG